MQTYEQKIEPIVYQIKNGVLGHIAVNNDDYNNL